MNYFNFRSRTIAVIYKISNIFGMYCLRGFRLPETCAHSAFAPHQVVAQRRGGRVDAVRAGAGNVFVIVAAVPMSCVRVEAALLHHCLHQCLFLNGVELEARQDFVEQRGFGCGKVFRKPLYHAAVVGVFDFIQHVAAPFDLRGNWERKVSGSLKAHFQAETFAKSSSLAHFCAMRFSNA